jgi:hypothetical protein
MKTLSSTSAVVTFRILLLSVIACFSGCAASPQWQAAMSARESAPGKFNDGQCKPFAQYIARRVPGSETITWQWGTKSEYGTPNSATHMAVTWKKGNEVWMMDNFSSPVWVGYITTPRKEQVKQFFAHSYRVPPVGRPLVLEPTPELNVTVANHANR